MSPWLQGVVLTGLFLSMIVDWSVGSFELRTHHKIVDLGSDIRQLRVENNSHRHAMVESLTDVNSGLYSLHQRVESFHRVIGDTGSKYVTEFFERKQQAKQDSFFDEENADVDADDEEEEELEDLY